MSVSPWASAGTAQSGMSARRLAAAKPRFRVSLRLICSVMLASLITQTLITQTSRLLSQVMPDLILFDIDGTLVRRAGPHHRQALVDAIRQVTGLETTNDGIPVHGMLDPDIITSMLRAVDLDDTRIQAA